MKPTALLALLFMGTQTFLAHASTPKTYQQQYNDVHELVFNQAQILPEDSLDIQTEKSTYLAGELPHYQVTARKFTQQVRERLQQRTQQTLTDTVDSYDRLEKLVHSNGICMAGTWYITKQAYNEQNQAYTGLFAKDAMSPFIGRLSVALSDTTQDKKLAFGMAGKLFGNQGIASQNLAEGSTANFFVADVLTGTKRDSVFDAPMSNKPAISLRPSLLGLGLKIGRIFSKADSNANMRPVTDIARMGLTEGSTTVSPTYMMVLPYKPSGHSMTTGIDFRDEFELTPEEKTADMARYFAIYVSDTVSAPTHQPIEDGWQHTGFIEINETMVSYGCDRQLHFAHPRSESEL